MGRLRAWGDQSRAHRWGLRVGIAALVSLVLFVLSFGTAYALLDFPRQPEQLQTTLVLDAEGKPIGDLCKDQNRVTVPLDQISEDMQRAVLAAEDRKFYEHSGIDPVGTVRALVNDAKGGALQGGSTITQQLVKNIRLNADRTIWRKGKEAVLAVKVEQQMTKDEILELYLNTVYFGRGSYGVEVAANRYFGVKAAELNLAQSAFLAGLIRAPELADPATNPEEAKRRQSLVLGSMVRNGVLDADEAADLKAQPLAAVERRDPSCQLAGGTAFFVDQVRKWAENRFGGELAFGGGLRIHTTMRLSMQAAAEKAVSEVLNKPEDPDAALVAMSDDGAIVAMVGGKDFATSKVNLAIGREGGNLGRQAGSTYKPVVLAAAFEAGIPVNQRYDGPPKTKVPFERFPDYELSNYGDKGFGSIDLYQATANSVNTVYAQLMSETGIQNVAGLSAKLGIEVPKDQHVPALTLGINSVNPLQMTRAYMTFANRGERPEPYYVSRVTTASGKTIYEAAPKRESVYAKQYADLVNRVLQDVVNKGSGTAANIRRPVAGKTGTTEDNGDAWFVGYTPKLGAAVWMGYKEGSDRKMDSVHGIAVTGGTFPAQIWGRFMRAATQGLDTGGFTTPPKELLNAKPKGEPPPPAPAEEAPTTTTTSTSTTSTTAPESSTTTTSTSAPLSTSTTAPPTTTTTTTPSTTTTVKARDTGG